MHRSAVLRWGAAALVAVVTSLVVASDLAELHRRARDLGPERRVLVADRDLPLGTTVRDGDLATRTVHASQLPDGTTTDRDAVRDRVVVVPILAGAYVTPRHLAPSDREGLSGVVPAGSRAVRLEPVASPALRPGDLVDVLALFDVGTDARAGVAARAALVVGVDGHLPDSAGTFGVTLLVDAEELERVAEAVALGTLTLALAAPEESVEHDAPSDASTEGAEAR